MDNSDQTAEAVRNIIDSHLEGLESGVRAVEMRIHPAIATLRREYAAAQKDPQSKIPTRLELAIINLIAQLPLPPEKPAWADRVDHDRDVCGRPLKPGT